MYMRTNSNNKATRLNIKANIHARCTKARAFYPHYSTKTGGGFDTDLFWFAAPRQTSRVSALQVVARVKLLRCTRCTKARAFYPHYSTKTAGGAH